MTTFYEERLEADLDEIRAKVLEVSELIEAQVRDAVHALLEDDRELANEVILGDRRVNRRAREIDELAHSFIVRYAPSAGPLRFASAALRLSVALERIGDYASTIGRESIHLSQSPPGRVSRDIELISMQARKILHSALRAFNDGDASLARSTFGDSDQTDGTLEKVQSELVRADAKDKATLRDIFALLRITNLIKRVAEQAENICEQTLFALTGELKEPKAFRILFVDKRNMRGSQMAMAYARKAFPESGEYNSAGWAPGTELAPGLAEFMDARGGNLHAETPSPLRPIEEEPQHPHVIVGLSERAERHITEIPFRTILLSWDLAELDLPDDANSDEDYERLYKFLAPRIQDLMKTLRGSDAR